MKRLFGFVLLASSLVITRTAARDVSRYFLFPVSRIAPVAAPSDFVVHETTAKDGVPVRALELASSSGPTIVLFHSNRQTAESNADLARALHARGFGVLLVEYRGFGWVDGAPSEQGLYLDAEAALDMLAARGIGVDRVVLWGTSLGSGVAAEMARRGRGSRLVLVTPYTSIPDLVTNVVPIAPANVLLDDRFDTFSKAREIRMPTLVIHGDADEIVPFAMGARLAGTIEGARLVRVGGGHHGDLFEREPERLLDAVSALR